MACQVVEAGNLLAASGRIGLPRPRPVQLVNVRCGHLAGARLLCMLGERLMRPTSGQDITVRLDGDEFAFLQVGNAYDPGLACQARITKIV